MKAISNYIATLITVSIIFSSVFFVVTTMMLQSRVGTQSFIKMAEMVDKAREAISMDYVVNGRNFTLMIFNKGDIDVTVGKLVIIDKHIRNYTFTFSKTIPIGSVDYVNVALPVEFNQIISMKLITARGNVFDVLARREPLITLKIDVNVTEVSVNETLRVDVTLTNTLSKTIFIEPKEISIRFINHYDLSDVTHRFKLIKTTPSTKVALTPGSTLIIRCYYTYTGGLNPGTPVDVKIQLIAETIDYETVSTSAEVIYLLVVS